MVAENNSKRCIIIYGISLYFCVCGWTLTRGANLQKHQYRKDPNNKWFKFYFSTSHKKH